MIGKPGFQRFEVNAYGKRIKELKFTQGTAGESFRTTIDLEVQRFAIELIKDKSGSVCVMDIYTGDIVTMVSSPTFNSNKFVHGISFDDWQKLIENKKKPLINKSNKIIEQLYDLLNKKITIIGVGGITSPSAAKNKIRSGAELLQLYTGLVYSGTTLIKEICVEIK